MNMLVNMRVLATVVVSAIQLHSVAAAPVTDTLDAAPHLLAKRAATCVNPGNDAFHLYRASRDGFWQCYQELLTKGNNGQQCVIGRYSPDSTHTTMCVQGDAKVMGQFVHNRDVTVTTSVNCANIAAAMLALSGCEHVGGWVWGGGVPGNGDIDLTIARACYPNC